MSQRVSGYARMPGDTYVTPQWVYDALYSVEPWAERAWDCAPVDANFDFLDRKWLVDRGTIATNPPFGLADEFIRHALTIADRVAMLLPVEFDCAKGRRDLFADSERFTAKYILTQRIRWENLEQKKAGPSQNHAWYVWTEAWCEAPFIGWLP